MGGKEMAFVKSVENDAKYLAKGSCEINEITSDEAIKQISEGLSECSLEFIQEMYEKMFDTPNRIIDVELVEKHRCLCDKQLITSKFCPECGKEMALRRKRYLVETNPEIRNHPCVAVRSNEFRNPKKGEYFLSGCIPKAYKAYNDMSSKYWIAEIL